MSDPTVIRPATLGDCAGMAHVVNRWIDATPWYPRTEDAGTIAGYIIAAYPKREMWVAGEEVEAYASFDPATGYLGALYCDRPGQGIGQRLLDRVRRWRDHLWLTTHVPNTAAQKFYLREGFEITGEQPAEPPDDPVPCYRLEWRR